MSRPCCQRWHPGAQLAFRILQVAPFGPARAAIFSKSSADPPSGSIFALPKIIVVSTGFHPSDRRGSGMTGGPDAAEAGFTLVFFALAVVALMGIAALVVDLGYWYLESTHIQGAADSAALGGVVYMPGDFNTAQSVADALASANGFDSANPGETVTAAPTSNPDQLKVTITDTNVPTFFAKVFGLDSISETRSSVAQYDPPVPLGSPENSLGTGNLQLGTGTLSCGGISCADYWLAVSGYCSAREDGDEFSTAYAGDRADGNTDCPLDEPGTNPSASTIFPNPDYRSSGYTYDIDVPGDGATNPVTPQDVTVEIYDPAYNPVRFSGSAYPDCTVASPASVPNDNTTGWGTDGTCAGYTDSHVTTDWLLDEPNGGSSGSGTVLYPRGSSTTEPGVFVSGDTTCENSWCSLGTIPAGSTPGTYQLHIWTQAGEPNSTGTNQFALRAEVGDGPGLGNFCGASGDSSSPPFSSCAGAVDTGPFTPCSTMAQNGQPADPLCPEVHGDQAMSIYVNSAPSTTCTPGARQEQASQNSPIDDVPASTAEACATFYLAQVSPDYVGQKMDILLFDPGEGATAIRILEPDASGSNPTGTDGIADVSPASFTYETCDDASSGCPGLPSGLDGPISVPASDFFSSDGNDPPVGTTTCICDPGLKPGGLPGRASPSQYNDRYLLIQTTVPANVSGNGGWFMVEYTFGGSSVSDRTTWGVGLEGSPVHLVL